MNTDATPGLDQQSTVRTTARVLAAVLLLAGVYLVYRGITGFVDQTQSMEVDADFGPILTIGAGGFCVVLGLAAANVGWLRAQASYVAGETVPVIKDSLDQLQAGPYCRQCGTRNDTSATFCDSCGTSLA
jgi:hypothetical protein